MKLGKDRQQRDRALSGSEVADQAAERLATIVAAAERAAEQVIDDAEAQARQIVAEAEAEADRTRGLALDAVERARRELDQLGDSDPAAPTAATAAAAEPAPPRNHLAAVPIEPPTDSGEESRPGPGSAAGARLLATQMAVSGSSREEIAARLRSGFEIEDTEAILDAILGPEG